MPTVRRCCIVGCLSNSRQNSALQFFQFPKPENPFHKLWKQACHASLSRILPFKKPVVCALHFAPNCIGGRRLTSSAVPSMRLEVPSNLKAVEQQAMVDEIERSRKCAYINAVVYEWLVRANLNPQLRGSITHGMIKEKADTAKQLIGSTAFFADNRWLNRFRETHLTGFAQKLATNQLKPLGPSLWIPDIVQDLQHLFPPTSADRVANFENVPEQYIDYMQQYGEYEEDDDQDSSSMDQSMNQSYDQKPYTEHKPYAAEQKPMQHYQQQNHYDPYAHHQGNYGYNNYYYNDYQNHQHNSYTSPHHHQQTQQQYHHHLQQQQQNHQQQQQQQQENPRTTPTQRPHSHSPAEVNSNRSSPYPQSNGAAKRLKLQQDEDEVKIVNGNCNSNSNNANDNDNEIENDTEDGHDNDVEHVTDNGNNNEDVEDLTDGPEPNQNSNSAKAVIPAAIAKTNGSSTPQSSHSNSASPKPPTNGQSNGGSATNGHSTPVVTSKELANYAQALEYLKPLEDFALFRENFRAIGLISQLEVILRKGTRLAPSEFDD